MPLLTLQVWVYWARNAPWDIVQPWRALRNSEEKPDPAHCSWKAVLLLGTDPEDWIGRNLGPVSFHLVVVVVLFSPKLNLNTMLKKGTDHEEWEADSWVATGQVPMQQCELLTFQKNLWILPDLSLSWVFGKDFTIRLWTPEKVPCWSPRCVENQSKQKSPGVCSFSDAKL